MIESTPGNFFLYLTSLIANLSALSAGIALSWTSPVLPKLNGHGHLDNNPIGRLITTNEESWITGLLSVGAILGPLISGHMADKIGRKKTLVLLAFPMASSLLISAFAQTVPLFYFARFLMGIGVGGVFTILPIYLTEIAEDHNRGLLGCSMGIFITSGTLLSYAIGPFLTIRNFCLVCVSPLLIYIPVFLIWIPESPQFLASLDNEKALEASLLKLRNKTHIEVQKEVTNLTKSLESGDQNKGRFVDLFKSKPYRKGLTIIVILIIFQQFAGINAVLSYMQAIFDAAGSGLAPEISPIIIGVVQVCCVILSSSIVDRLGRRMLLLMSSTGSGLSLVVLGIYFYLKANQFQVDALAWLPVSSLVVYIISFNIGFSSVPWAIMAELFPSNLKAVAATLTIVVCFIGCFLTTLFFPMVSLLLGMAQSFWLFAGVCGVGTVFIYLVLPETSGKSLHDILILLGGQKMT